MLLLEVACNNGVGGDAVFERLEAIQHLYWSSQDTRAATSAMIANQKNSETSFFPLRTRHRGVCKGAHERVLFHVRSLQIRKTMATKAVTRF